VRRRIGRSIIATTLLTLLLAGIGTLLLTRAEALRSAQSDLESQAGALATAFSAVPAVDFDNTLVRARLARLQTQLAEDDARLLVVRDGDAITEVPAGLPLDEIEPIELSDGSLSGRSGDVVYAVARIGGPTDAVAATGVFVVVTRDAGELFSPAFRWFFLSALASLGAALVVAYLLAGRLARPVRAAADATRQIAGGDFAARVEPPGNNAELDDLAGSVNELAGSLERSQGLEQQFLLSVSHDLRTPLTSIRGYADAIADGTAPDHVRAAAVIKSESQRLERLVGDLLDLAKLDARQFSLHPRTFELSDVTGDVVAGFGHRAESADIELDHVTAESAAPTFADPDRVAQVVANLVENALRYAGLRVTVATGCHPGWSWVVVADDGPGIAPDDLPHVFERLYVARRRPQRKETGSGLGLAIVRELTEAMGGTVTVTTPETGGTQFQVLLPTTEGPGAMDDRPTGRELRA